MQPCCRPPFFPPIAPPHTTPPPTPPHPAPARTLSGSVGSGGLSSRSCRKGLMDLVYTSLRPPSVIASAYSLNSFTDACGTQYHTCGRARA